MSEQNHENTEFALAADMFVPESYGLFEWSLVNDNHLQLTVYVPKIEQGENEIPVDVRTEHDDDMTCLFCGEIMYDEESGLYGAWCDYGDMCYADEDFALFEDAYSYVENECYKELLDYPEVAREHMTLAFSDMEWIDVSDTGEFTTDRTFVAEQGPLRAVLGADEGAGWIVGLEVDHGDSLGGYLGDIDWFSPDVHSAEAMSFAETSLRTRGFEVASAIVGGSLKSAQLVPGTRAFQERFGAEKSDLKARLQEVESRTGEFNNDRSREFSRSAGKSLNSPERS